MFQLPGCERFRVHVGQFLELESAFHGHRVAHVPSQEQHGLGVGKGAGQVADWLHGVEDLLHLLRHPGELFDDRVDLVAELQAAHLGQVEADQVAGDELGEEGFGSGHTHLGTACVYSTPSDSRGIVEPFTLQMASTRDCCSRA